MLDVEFLAIEIRRLAAAYQTGRGLDETKIKIDLMLQAFSDRLGPDKDQKTQLWTELALLLKQYSSVKADPRWLTIIRHARRRANSRKYTVNRK